MLLLLLVTLAAIAPLIGLSLPLYPLLAILLVLIAWNAHTYRQLAHPVTAPQLAGQLAVDLFGLAGCLFFTGGATNPLVFLLLPPVAIGALTLPVSLVAGIATLAVLLYSVLMISFIPLPLADPGRAASLHLSGMWLTFVVSTVMIGWFIVRMTRVLRKLDAELAAAREQALRDERVLAMGTLAAGAAHELGTPLATMAVLADELEHDARLGAEAHADLQLMREQIAYCKRIITRLTEQAGAGRTEQMEPIACDTWFHHLYEDWRALRGFPQSELCINLSAAPAPRIIAEPTLGQGLVNLLDNALRAGAPVLMSVEWTSQEVRIEIRDQGQGFSPEALNQAGRLPFAAGPEGSGIGLILTRSAIERLGGQLRLSNLADGGALAQVVLPLARIAAHG